VPQKRLHGVHVPHFKNTAGSVPERIPVPQTVSIPMSMNIGAPAKPVVKVGDIVKVGQLIGEPGGFVSAPIHSSVSGTVKKIDDIVSSAGTFMKAIEIATDGNQETIELTPPDVHDYESFINAVKASGVVGLGGAGFPTAVKLDVKDLSKIKAVIINGAECEPYVTSDTRTMIDDADLVADGIRLLQKYLEVKRVVIGIEKNKPECIKTMKEKTSGMTGVEVQALPSIYPQGGEKVLIYNVTGEVVPEGGLPIDVGAVVINCTTLAAVAKFVATGMPLVEKCVTVSGTAVKEPKNVIAPIGTPLIELFNYCGGFKEDPAKVIYGGPMMGITVPDVNVPVLKNTNAILALDAKSAGTPKPTACIRCGKCIDACPLNLSPIEFENAFEKNDAEALEKLKINLCMECGCCSYVCPAFRPHVQNNKLAKGLVRDLQAARKAEAERKKALAEAKEKEAANE